MRERTQRGSSGEQLAIGLGLFSLGLGLAELAAPDRITRLIGLGGSERHRGLLQAFGVREIGTGLAILAQPGNPAWLWARVGGDGLDLACLTAALDADEAERGPVLSAIAAVAGVTLLDVMCAMQLGRQDRRSEPPRRARDLARGVSIERVTTINRPIEEVYAFWRRLENLPRFMRHLESVRTTSARHSRWRARGPAGMTVEWDAEILQERENEWIAWRSFEDSDIQNSGSVRFSPAPGARGTEVRVQLQYAPPAGALGRTIAKLFGEEPDQQIHEDLHRVKQLLETGEIPISDGPSLWRSAQPSEHPDELRRLAGVSR
jgi:uncharacterized membrane protein